MNDVIISINSLVKRYGAGRNTITVLDSLSLQVFRGERVSVIGPSGAGKSTLLNCMGCLDTFQSGLLSINGKEVSGFSIEDLSGFRNKTMGYIFQMHNLLPEFTALENVMLPLLIRRVLPSKARSTALEMLDRLGLAARVSHKPAEMSGGECQRTAVARALVGKPDLILADEPTGSLDTKNSDILIDLLFEYSKESSSTVIIVTHDSAIAARTDRTVTLVDGRITADSALSAGN